MEQCLSASSISMSFSGVPALQNVDFSVRPGEIRALIGANGAGKSTLMKILAGSNPGYTGAVTLDGETLTLKSPRDAQAHGIRLVSQEMDTALVPGLSVMENILMNDLNTRRCGWVDRKSARLDAQIALGAMGCKLEADFGTPHAMRLTVLAKGRCFGEMSILEELPRSTTAVAEEDTSLITYPADLLSEVILQNPGFALELLENLSSRLRSSTAELERMHKMLLYLSSVGSTDQGMDEYIRLHTTLRPDGVPRFYLSV